MLRHLGYSSATQSIDARTNRVCRHTDATPDRLRSLIRDNLRDLGRILRFHCENGIAFYRVCSQIIPFGSHPNNSIAWWDEFSRDLEAIGQIVRDHGLRLQMHPGQHTLLNSPSPETVALSILELGWHVRLFDAMQIDGSNKLVIRVGGTFGDKVGSFDRFVSVVGTIPDSWRRRLAIENDEVQYNALDVIAASGRTGLPVVLACYSDQSDSAEDLSNPTIVRRCFETWKAKDGPPMVHLGSPRRRVDDKSMGSEWIEPCDLESLLEKSPAEIPFDCLLEASQGDRALFGLRERTKVREHGKLLYKLIGESTREL